MTALTMALMAALLLLLSPRFSEIAALLRHPQQVVDTAGPDAAVVRGVGLLAWAVWGWAALGLTLTAAAALPGLFGGAAHHALRLLLPSGARRAAALTLGVGLGLAAPLTPAAATPASTVSATDGTLPGPARTPVDVPDWPGPTRDPAPRPQEPAVPASADEPHVVVRGDCLWSIAAGQLATRDGRQPTNGEIASAVRAWWRTNAAVIGPDPDLILPGQVLSPPEPH